MSFVICNLSENCSLHRTVYLHWSLLQTMQKYNRNLEKSQLAFGDETISRT